MKTRAKNIINLICFIMIVLFFQFYDWFHIPPVFSERDVVVNNIIFVLSILIVPSAILNAFGILWYGAFTDEVKLNDFNKTSDIPFVSIRVVTRGIYQNVVRANVYHNLKTCLETGMTNFMIEVVTEKTIGFEDHKQVREIVVPANYTTKRGSLFKARNLQYCLEEHVNILKDKDYIVHLDEDSVLTKGAVRGILNFVMEGKHDLGHGLITYTRLGVSNWISTIADFGLVAAHMGILRMQFKWLNGMNLHQAGSFNVVKFAAEKAATFDIGPSGSLAEDMFHYRLLARLGYKYAFVQGEVYESSAISVYDFYQQRKRWLQGIIDLCMSRYMPIQYKLLPFCLYFSSTLITVLQVIAFFTNIIIVPGFIMRINFAVLFYSSFYGFFKSYDIKKLGFIKMILIIIGILIAQPVLVVIKFFALFNAISNHKRGFYVTPKANNKIVSAV